MMTNHIDEVFIPKRVKHAQGLERCTKGLSRIWPVTGCRPYFAGLLVAGCFTFVPLTLANGASGGHMSAGGSHEHGQGNEERSRYSNPFWSPSIPYQASSYNLYYLYAPTPEQQAGAKRQIEAYLIAVKKGRKHAATHRYICVETLRPTKKQLGDFAGKQPPGHPVVPAQLHCLMVYDTQSKEFVGSGCYLVGTEPSAGAVSKFESVSAEFVGHSTM